MHKAKVSLRVIVERTSLTLRTVRTIVNEGTRKERSRTNELRRIEFNKLVHAEQRVTKRIIDRIPKRLDKSRVDGAALLKAMKGIGTR